MGVKHYRMPGKRSPGQTMIGLFVDERFADLIDDARGTATRSQFARDAVKEKLASMGIPMDDVQTTPRDRVRKRRKAIAREVTVTGSPGPAVLPTPSDPESTASSAAGKVRAKRGLN